MQQFVHFAFQQFAYRDARPFCHDSGDFFRVHFFFEQSAAFLQHFQFFFSCGNFCLQFVQGAIAQTGRFLEVGITFCHFHLVVNLVELFFKLLQVEDGLFFCLPLGGHRGRFFFQVSQFALKLFQAILRGFVFFFLQRLLFNLELHNGPIHLVQRLWLRVNLGAQVCGRLVDQVDGLVWQFTVSDVAL